MFGNITGGGKLSSKTNYNPTPYVVSVKYEFVPEYTYEEDTVAIYVDFFYFDRRFFSFAA